MLFYFRSISVRMQFLPSICCQTSAFFRFRSFCLADGIATFSDYLLNSRKKHGNPIKVIFSVEFVCLRWLPGIAYCPCYLTFFSDNHHRERYFRFDKLSFLLWCTQNILIFLNTNKSSVQQVKTISVNSKNIFTVTWRLKEHYRI